MGQGQGQVTERTRIIELDLQRRDATEEEEPNPQYCEMHRGEMGRRKDEKERSDCLVPTLWLLTEPDIPDLHQVISTCLSWELHEMARRWSANGCQWVPITNKRGLVAISV
jgi:hypothetical protein